jgi:hypothetical protein
MLVPIDSLGCNEAALDFEIGFFLSELFPFGIGLRNSNFAEALAKLVDAWLKDVGSILSIYTREHREMNSSPVL